MRMRRFVLVLVLVTCVVPARATVITTGAVNSGLGDPGGTATQPDPWILDHLHVGRYYDGTLNVEAGGQVSSNFGYIGGVVWFSHNPLEWEGIVTVSGTGSTWTNTYDLIVGDRGRGTLNVEAGGEVFSNRNGYIGDQFFLGGCCIFIPSRGIARVTGVGSKWASYGSLTVGNKGRGTLTIEAGGEVSNGEGMIGFWRDLDEFNWSSTGTVTVTGTGSKWTNSSKLTVGNSGSGTLTVEAGGEVSNTTGYIGYESSSTGVATVAGAGSKWTNSSKLTVGNSGSGTLTVEAGGEVSNTSSLTVGNSGDGFLSVRLGGEVSNTSGILGNNSGSTGAAMVSWESSKWTNSSSLTVGNSGDGFLSVRLGGEVSNTTGYIGYESSSTGIATVAGAGSRWTSSSKLTVGHRGNGTLTVEAGGEVSNATSGFIGFNPGSTGIALVTGTGSKWTNSGNLHVGRRGNGTLTVEAGGVVSNTTGFIGFNPGSTGAATVTGAGSWWTNSGDLYIGGNSSSVGGAGTLSVNEGGLVAVLGTAKLWGEGVVNLDGGALETGMLDLTVGTLICSTVCFVSIV